MSPGSHTLKEIAPSWISSSPSVVVNDVTRQSEINYNKAFELMSSQLLALLNEFK